MNILNDTPQKETVPPLDPFRVITLALFAGAAMSTFLLAPMPLLLAGWRLPEPWPKVVALGGAAIALLVLEAPMPWVAVAFAMSLIFSDQVNREKPVWGALGLTVLVSMLVAVGVFFFQVKLAQASPEEFWRNFVHSLVTEMQGFFDGKSGVDFALLEQTLYQQAPFLLAGATFISAWVSLGAAAHFGWLHPERGPSGRSLRESLRLPPWFAIVASFGFLASILFHLPFYGAGVVRFMGCLLFMQGTLCLSDILSRRSVSRAGRTWVYALSVVFGFYALLALGVLSPWYFRAARLAGPVKVLEEKEKV
jgi:hypothetical protein